jgi:ABC-type sugar transport system ATPase subunit
MTTPDPAIRFEHVTKRFPGVLALDAVSFEIAAGSCHALCGENGAGKSTLGKILGGIDAPDAGRIVVFGEPIAFSGPPQALAAGVAIVHQELAFCENLSVAENLCLGALPHQGPFLSRDGMRSRATEMLAGIGASIDVDRLVGDLSTGQQQMLQIATAVGRSARIIVFDEPTSSLSQHEAERLYSLIGTLRERGVTLIYVSHRMDEIFRLCDTITVLRDGRHVSTQPAAELSEAALVEAMIGRPLGEYFPKHLHAVAGTELLRVEGLTSPGRFHDVSFSLHAGEVVGLAGLVGAGRSEVARALFGLDPEATGRVWIDGVTGLPRSPVNAMTRGVALVPEDRKRQGLILSMSALSNTTLPTLPALSRFTFIRQRAERALARSYFNRLGVRVSALDAMAAGLSGGTQQKLVLAKWLAAKCRILILDEPTRGVDVGAKAEIHVLIDELASAGHAVLLISSELPEVVHLSTRIIVLRNGGVAGELPRAQATQAGLMRLMAGATAHA